MTSTKLHSWTEWKDRCALAICSPDTQMDLAQYANPIIRNKLSRLSKELADSFFQSSTQVNENSMNLKGWHLFESYTHTVSGKTGKRWKDWMCERAQTWHEGPLVSFEKDFCIQSVTAIRYFFQAECEGKVPVETLDALLNASELDFFSIAQFFPGLLADNPENECALNELHMLAAQNAEKIFTQMDFRYRLVLGATSVGISMANPEIELVCGCKKTVLYGIQDKIGELIKSQLQQEYEGEDQATIKELEHMTAMALGKLCLEWVGAEKSLQKLFLDHNN